MVVPPAAADSSACSPQTMPVVAPAADAGAARPSSRQAAQNRKTRSRGTREVSLCWCACGCCCNDCCCCRRAASSPPSSSPAAGRRRRARRLLRRLQQRAWAAAAVSCCCSNGGEAEGATRAWRARRLAMMSIKRNRSAAPRRPPAACLPVRHASFLAANDAIFFWQQTRQTTINAEQETARAAGKALVLPIISSSEGSSRSGRWAGAHHDGPTSRQSCRAAG